ncbi:MAG: HIT family protein [Aigarchaeota archaeon]|nr:HIT family protein [Aigarchaeota archaeon]
MADECVFCRIASGEEWGAIVWDDGEYVAFMDKYPVSVGHTLVAPKFHRSDVLEMSFEEAGRLFSLAAKVARAIKASLNPDGINILQNNGAAAGQVIFHAHVHVIPRYAGHHGNPSRPLKGMRLSVTEEELLRVAERIGETMRRLQG